MKQISTEMLIKYHRQGIMLVRPEAAKNVASSQFIHLDTYLNTPYEFFMVDANFSVMLVNDNVAITCGADSSKEMIGTSPAHYFDKESAAVIKSYDDNVLNQQRIQVNEYDLIRKNEIISHYVAVRLPIYDENEKIIGVAGYSFMNGRGSLTKFISEVLNLRAPYMQAEAENKFDHIHLSIRERQCLQLLIRGKTMRDIAVSLDLSPRTIESYVENIKNKFGVKKRSELIELVFDYLSFIQ